MQNHGYTQYSSFVFDLDGVLADTEPICFQAVQDLFPADSTRLNQEDYCNMIGLDYADTARYLKGKYNLEGTVEFLVEQQKVNAVKRIDRGLIPLPFIPQLIDALLSHQLPLGLASNSPRVYVEHALSSLGFKEKFSCVYARDDLNNGKPDPEPYLAACACLGADPASSLAVEDSLVGAQSAAAAGMTVAMVCPVPPEEIPPSFTRLVWFPDAASLYSALFPVQ